MSDDKPKFELVSNVVELQAATTGFVAPDKVLEGAKGKLEFAMVVGWDSDENLYIACSNGNRGDMVYILELAKSAVISQMFD